MIKRKLSTVLVALVMVGAVQTAFAGAARAAGTCVPIFDPQQTILLQLCAFVGPQDPGDQNNRVHVYIADHGLPIASVYLRVGEEDGDLNSAYSHVNFNIGPIGPFIGEFTPMVYAWVRIDSGPTGLVQVCASLDREAWICIPDDL